MVRFLQNLGEPVCTSAKEIPNRCEGEVDRKPAVAAFRLNETQHCIERRIQVINDGVHECEKQEKLSDYGRPAG